MSKIKTVAKGNYPFFCKDIKEILKVNDDLKKKIDQLEAHKEKQKSCFDI